MALPQGRFGLPPFLDFPLELLVGSGEFRGAVSDFFLKFAAGLLQRIVGPFAIGDILDGAQHGDGLPVAVELQSTEPVDPAHLLIAVADDPIFTIKGLPRCHDFLEEIVQHGLAFIRMHQIVRSVNRSAIVSGDVEDAVDNRRTRPTPRGDIVDVEAQVGDFLGFEKPCLSFDQGFFRPLLVFDVNYSQFIQFGDELLLRHFRGFHARTCLFALTLHAPVQEIVR